MTPQPSPHVGGSLYMRSSTQGTERKTALTTVLESSQAPFAAVGVFALWDPNTDAPGRVMCLFARFRTALAGFGCDIDPPWPRLLGLIALLAMLFVLFQETSNASFPGVVFVGLSWTRGLRYSGSQL